MTEKDFYAWTQEQAAALKAHNVAVLDWNDIAEEIEDMGKNEKRALLSHLERRFLHLLKWMHQPTFRTPSWRVSITHSGNEILDILEDSPSLYATLPTLIPKAFTRARQTAAIETGLPIETFPDVWPWGEKNFWTSVGCRRIRTLLPANRPKAQGVPIPQNL